jgi:hypothetical protein
VGEPIQYNFHTLEAIAGHDFKCVGGKQYAVVKEGHA